MVRLPHGPLRDLYEMAMVSFISSVDLLGKIRIGALGNYLS